MRAVFHDADGRGAELEGLAGLGGDEFDVDLRGGQVRGGVLLGCHGFFLSSVGWACVRCDLSSVDEVLSKLSVQCFK